MNLKKTKRKKIVRVGMRVRSVIDPSHTFTIDKSLLPQRLFHEKGSRNWWIKTEIEALSASRKTKGYITIGKIARSRFQRSLAFLGISEPLSPKSDPEYRLICADCGIRFTRKRKLRPGQKPFCCDAHRTRHWKRANETPRPQGSKGIAV